MTLTIEPISEIPDVPFGEYAQRELEEAGPWANEVVKRSRAAYLASSQNGPGIVFGLYQPTLLSEPHLWFLLCRKINVPELVTLRKMKRELVRQFGPFKTGIEETFEEGVRFAKFLRLERTDDVMQVFNRTLTVYRGRA